MFDLKLLSVLVTALVALLGGFYPFFKQKKDSQKILHFPIGETLACGIFLGAGLLHMLSESSHGFIEQGYEYPFAMLLAGSLFLLLLLFEHIAREFKTKNAQENPLFAVLATIMLCIHSFLEGAALGLTSDFAVLLVILLAIVVHKGAASFALAVQITKSRISWIKGLVLFGIFVFMTPIGIVFGQGLQAHLSNLFILQPIFLAFAAGTFIYLGTLHGLNRAVMVEQCCNLTYFSFVILGFCIMAIVAIWA